MTVYLTVPTKNLKEYRKISLTDTAIRNAKPKDKQYKLSDQKGLYLLIENGCKYFRFDYRNADKRKTLALGVYPELTLAQIREKRDEALKRLNNNIEPIQQHKKNHAK